jgi:hypothetical protein
VSARGATLIAVALALSVGLLGVQLASGGADFVPQRPADPCQNRGLKAHDENDLEALAEIVVLTGVDEAACKLGVSRERLLLALPSAKDRAELARETGTDEAGLERALKDGLRAGVERLDRSGQLPKTSALLPSVADQLGVSKSLVGAIPDSVVDGLLPSDEVLRRAIDKIDMHSVLTNLDDRQSLESTLRKAITQAAIDEVKAKIKDALPGPLQTILG